MKALILIICVAAGISCTSSKGGNTAASTHQEAPGAQKTSNDLPPCVQKMISGYKAEEKQNPPRQIFSYSYKGQTVYYVTPPCCDFFSDLFDSSCTLIGHPDGGFTGKGDGKTPDFLETRTDEKLLWQDDRK